MAQITSRALTQQTEVLPKSTENTIKISIAKPHVVDKSIFIPRDTLLSKLKTTIQKLNILIVRGSSGMGKSTLTLQLVEAERDQWERINLRGMVGKNISDMLNGLYDYYLNNPSNVILDDINFGEDCHIYLDSLERLINFLSSKDKKIIITTQKQLPQVLSSKLNLTQNQDFVVPKFSKEEIISLLILNSCPEPEFWVKDIEITTKSHPQLVHARIRRMKQDGWDKSKVIFKTEELTNVKHEVVANLISELPSPESRSLLLRLSILTGAFKRRNAIILAKYPPEISTPGAFLNQLIGPYIEQEGDDIFRLTPLLDNAFQDNFSKEEVKHLHQLAGESYLSKTLSPNDLSNIFLHGVTSGSGRIMYFAFAAFQSIDSPHKKLIYPYLEWLMFVHIGTGKAAFEEDEVLNLMFRHIQFSLAVETGNTTAALNIADTWFEEVKRFKNVGPFKKEAQAKTFPFMFFLSVFRYSELSIPVNKIIEWIVAAYDFINKNPDINSLFKKSQKWEVSSWKELIPEIALTKSINSNNIELFMSSISTIKGGSELLAVIDKDDMLPKRIVDNVWLDQIDSKTPNWTSALEALRKIKDWSISHKAFNIAALSIRAIAMIKNEYTNDQTSAKQELSDGIKKVGKHPEIINYEAKISFIDKDYKTALKIWESVFPTLTIQADLSTAFAYRDAAVSAANLSDWEKAANYFLKASEFAKKQNEKLYETQCLADYGFALWKLEKYPECIEVYTKVIDAFPKLPNPKSSIRSLGLLKMTSNSLIYFKKTLNPQYRTIGIPYTEPYPGANSQTEYSENLRDLPQPPSIVLWVFLAEVEEELNVGSVAYEKMKSVFEDLPILFQADAKKIELVKSLRTGNVTNLVKDIVDFWTLTNISVESNDRAELVRKVSPEDVEQTLSKHGSTVLNLIASSILSFTVKNSYKDLPFESFEQAAKDTSLDKYKEWKTFYELMKNISLKSAREVLKNGNEEVYLRLLAAIYILSNDEDRDWSLYACAILTSTLKDLSLFCWVLEDYLVELCVKRWTEIASTLYDMYRDDESKKVLDACNDTETKGIKKAAKIVLAAKDICFLKIDNVLNKLEDIVTS